MGTSAARRRDDDRRAHARLRVIEHYLRVTKNVSRTCRFFGMSRTTFYVWFRRFEKEGAIGLRERPRRPHMIRFQIPPEVIALILQIRREKEYGAPRISLHLQRYHQVYVSATTIVKILARHHMRRLGWNGRRPPPRKQAPPRTPGESLQVDVNFVPKRISGNLQFYQFTAIDEASRFRVLRIFDHNSTKSAVAFLDEVRKVFPTALKRVQTDNGSEFGWDFTWHLRDLGIDHRRIPRGCPEVNGKVERSHRTDSQEFYRRIKSASLRQLAQALATWEREYNFGRPHMALKGATPAEQLHGSLQAAKRGVRDLS
jgi:transposase InsO family protein